MKKILVAVDGSDHSNKAIDVAASLALQHNAHVIVLHVLGTAGPSNAAKHMVATEYGDELVNRVKTARVSVNTQDSALYAQDLIEQHGNTSTIINSIVGETVVASALSRMRELGVDDVESRIVEGKPGEKILELVENQAIDALTMGCRGMGNIKGLIAGSVSRRVAHDADCMVVMVK